MLYSLPQCTELLDALSAIIGFTVTYELLSTGLLNKRKKHQV